jgi:hypothetical protein
VHLGSLLEAVLRRVLFNILFQFSTVYFSTDFSIFFYAIFVSKLYKANFLYMLCILGETLSLLVIANHKVIYHNLGSAHTNIDIPGIKYG